MAIKRLTTIFVALCCSLSVNAHMLSDMSDKQLLKNYALSTCLATFYKGSEVSKDAIVAMQGYRDYSDLPLEVFFEVSKLVESSDLSGYSSKKGNTIELGYCIDFAESEGVELLYQQALASEL